ncbi:MAG: histidine kinase dimerization/phospho-acceptor domain-containing protein, partial [Gillisia sp.]
MKNAKRSITFKVVLGYLSIAALAGIAVWFTYTQVLKFSELTKNNDLNNRQLVLVSEIATELYETESTGRRFIQSEDSTYLHQYSRQISTIQNSISSLKSTYADPLMKQELDSISTLLSKKGENLQDLLQLRSRDRNTSYYREVIKELEKVDKSFNQPDYENRFLNLKPYQRRALIKLLEYSQNQNEEKTGISADSLVKSVKKVLSELETENQQFRNIINKKENELLDNDMVLNEQLRKLLNSVEREERQTTLQKAQNFRVLLTRISRIIIIIGIASVLIILVFLLLITQDISRSQRYRMEMEKAKAFTESLMKRREQFIAAITHDLRSPLNTVMGYSELMEKSNLSDKQQHYLGYIKKSSEFILHLVNDLLDLSKLDAGKMLIEKLPFNPKKLLEEAVYNTIPENEHKKLKVQIYAAEDTDCQVLSDPFRIKQLLSNLISNAYKFTEEGEITASIHLEKQIENSYLMKISIKDSGIGISEEKQEEIFEEFSQEHQQIEKKYGGTGLG